MKKSGFWDRVLIYLYALLTMLLTLLVMLRAFGFDAIDWLFKGLRQSTPGFFWRLIVIGLCVIVVLLGVFTVVVITPSRKKKNATITLVSEDGGAVRVALPAIREMAAQAMKGVDGLKGSDIEIGATQDSVTVKVVMDVLGSVHVPTLTANLQHAIRRRIQKNCGVEVSDVTIVVNSVLPDPAERVEKIETQPFEQNAAQEDFIPQEAPAEEAPVPAAPWETPAEETETEPSEQE